MQSGSEEAGAAPSSSRLFGWASLNAVAARLLPSLPHALQHCVADSRLTDRAANFTRGFHTGFGRAATKGALSPGLRRGRGEPTPRARPAPLSCRAHAPAPPVLTHPAPSGSRRSGSPTLLLLAARTRKSAPALPPSSRPCRLGMPDGRRRRALAAAGRRSASLVTATEPRGRRRRDGRASMKQPRCLCQICICG